MINSRVATDATNLLNWGDLWQFNINLVGDYGGEDLSLRKSFLCLI